MTRDYEQTWRKSSDVPSKCLGTYISFGNGPMRLVLGELKILVHMILLPAQSTIHWTWRRSFTSLPITTLHRLQARNLITVHTTDHSHPFSYKRLRKKGVRAHRLFSASTPSNSVSSPSLISEVSRMEGHDQGLATLVRAASSSL